jgi:hypothetical protein
MSIPHNTLTHGDPVTVGDWLAGDETGASLDPVALRAALINALDRIARLEAAVMRLQGRSK